MTAAMMKLGKKAPRHDDRTLLFENYFKRPALPAIPSEKQWGSKVGSWGMMANDDIGDCTCAGAGHLIQTWTSEATGITTTPPDSDIIAAYSAITGYDPKDPDTDQGAVELDVLKYWKNHGIAGHKIDAFMSVRPSNIQHIFAASFIFGGVYLGIALPESAADQLDKGEDWDVDLSSTKSIEPGSWGGHAVGSPWYTPRGLWCVTWGKLQFMTIAFFRRYCDEAYAIKTKDWFGSSGRTPSGFDDAALTADLRAL